VRTRSRRADDVLDRLAGRLIHRRADAVPSARYSPPSADADGLDSSSGDTAGEG
jgi:hypothetical protein